MLTTVTTKSGTAYRFGFGYIARIGASQPVGSAEHLFANGAERLAFDPIVPCEGDSMRVVLANGESFRTNAVTGVDFLISDGDGYFDPPTPDAGAFADLQAMADALVAA
jgi:hypothetical protein